MSVNAMCTGANQKNNRWPLMQLENDDVEQSLDRLRELGAVAEVQGGGRVPKYRHYLYEWLGVDKVELAVMAELLLRGAQTEGELRGRAARMEPITDLAALRPVLDSLKAKGLVISLSPEGRGHVVTHGLYPPDELARVKVQFSAGGESGATEETGPRQSSTTAAAPGTAAGTLRDPLDGPILPPEVEALRRELDEVRGHVRQLRGELDEVTAQLRTRDDEVRGIKDSLGL